MGFAIMSVKNYILTVALVAAVLIGFVVVWTMNAGPRSATTAPTAVGPSSAGQSTASTAPALPAVTIVPAQLNEQGIPARLATVALTRVITGTAALDEMTQLHGQGFDLLTGYVAHYGQEQAILWVAAGQGQECGAGSRRSDGEQDRAG